MKKTPTPQNKGDGKGKLKTRKLSAILEGEKITIAVRPYAVRIKQAEWKTPKMPEQKRNKRSQTKRQIRRKR